MGARRHHGGWRAYGPTYKRPSGTHPATSWDPCDGHRWGFDHFRAFYGNLPYFTDFRSFCPKLDIPGLENDRRTNKSLYCPGGSLKKACQITVVFCRSGLPFAVQTFKRGQGSDPGFMPERPLLTAGGVLSAKVDRSVHTFPYFLPVLAVSDIPSMIRLVFLPARLGPSGLGMVRLCRNCLLARKAHY